MQHLRRADYKRMPWKNGQGVTEEVMAHPPGSDISTFGWRLSIAHVGADGPFSVFAGIDRTIALLDGAGLSLDLTTETVELGARTAPFVFSGDLEISSRNKAGPTIDLNIMTRRGGFTHRMWRSAGGTITIAEPDTILIFNHAANVQLGGRMIDVERFDALVLNADDGALHAPPDIDILMIEVSPVSR